MRREGNFSHQADIAQYRSITPSRPRACLARVWMYLQAWSVRPPSSRRTNHARPVGRHANDDRDGQAMSTHIRISLSCTDVLLSICVADGANSNFLRPRGPRRCRCCPPCSSTAHHGATQRDARRHEDTPRGHRRSAHSGADGEVSERSHAYESRLVSSRPFLSRVARRPQLHFPDLSIAATRQSASSHRDVILGAPDESR